MNPRSPLTPGGAFARVKDILGAKVCAQYLGVSEWTIYDRCNVEEFAKLNLSYAEAFELDRMCKERCNEAPLANLYNERLSGTPGPAEPTLERTAIELARDVGEVEGEVLSIGDTTKRPLSNRKAVELLRTVAKVKRDAAAIESIAEKAGGVA